MGDFYHAAVSPCISNISQIDSVLFLDPPDNEDGSWAVSLHPPRLLEVTVVVHAEPRVVVADAVAAPVQPVPRAEKPSINDVYTNSLPFSEF